MLSNASGPSLSPLKAELLSTVFWQKASIHILHLLWQGHSHLTSASSDSEILTGVWTWSLFPELFNAAVSAAEAPVGLLGAKALLQPHLRSSHLVLGIQFPQFSDCSHNKQGKGPPRLDFRGYSHNVEHEHQQIITSISVPCQKVKKSHSCGLRFKL